MFAKKVFISHSSENKEIADHLCAFISRLGVKQDCIFCSSVIGQGVENGEKLNDRISKAIRKSRLLIFLISRDFIASSYCMEELGVGWYLAQNKSTACFYIILPDIDISELIGFVNSKIDRFTFLDFEHRNDLGQFAEDVCKKLCIKPPKHSTVTNIEDNFTSAIKLLITQLLKSREEQHSEKAKLESKVRQLENELSLKEASISRLRSSLESAYEDIKKQELLVEIRVIESIFLLLGFSSGITKEQYNMFRKDFWFGLVNRYLNLQNKLELEPTNDCMELLIATIYIANNDSQKAYQHILNFAKLCDYPISIYNFQNILPYFNGSLQEVIDILQYRAKAAPEGQKRDSYFETIQNLEKREAKLLNQE